jgi:filamentous hemagglutinin family protein
MRPKLISLIPRLGNRFRPTTWPNTSKAWPSAVIPTLLALLVGASGGSAKANDSVKPDGTLSTNSVVTPSTAGGNTTYTITGGTARNSGRYLFHSFQAFSLLKNEIGHFDNANSVQTIFGRVTGGNQSNIDGLIKANGTANLFLINPKGIVFGPNARIDLGGAFKASTATALDFNGKLFSAINPQDAPLLSSDIVPGLQYGATPATLENQGVLVVQDGKELLLAGGPLDTVVSSGTIRAYGGRITLEGGTTRVSGGSIQADKKNTTTPNGLIFIRATNTSSITDGEITANGGSIAIAGDTSSVTGGVAAIGLESSACY